MPSSEVWLRLHTCKQTHTRVTLIVSISQYQMVCVMDSNESFRRVFAHVHNGSSPNSSEQENQTGRCGWRVQNRTLSWALSYRFASWTQVTLPATSLPTQNTLIVCAHRPPFLFNKICCKFAKTRSRTTRRGGVFCAPGWMPPAFTWEVTFYFAFTFYLAFIHIVLRLPCIVVCCSCAIVRIVQ